MKQRLIRTLHNKVPRMVLNLSEHSQGHNTPYQPALFGTLKINQPLFVVRLTVVGRLFINILQVSICFKYPPAVDQGSVPGLKQFKIQMVMLPAVVNLHTGNNNLHIQGVLNNLVAYPVVDPLPDIHPEPYPYPIFRCLVH